MLGVAFGFSFFNAKLLQYPLLKLIREIILLRREKNVATEFEMRHKHSANIGNNALQKGVSDCSTVAWSNSCSRICSVPRPLNSLH